MFIQIECDVDCIADTLNDIAKQFPKIVDYKVIETVHSKKRILIIEVSILIN